MGTLYLIATPIGNLKDITLRAIDVLQSVEFIASEDTRKTGQLLKHLESVTRPVEKRAMLISFYEQNELLRMDNILNLLRNDKDVALVSDAGTPTISDPGFKLVRTCIEEGIRVEALPGASSVITALITSGLPTDKFLFLGYPPKKPGKREKMYNEVKKLSETFDQVTPTIILFEAPHRIVKTLKEMQGIYGDIRIAVCRELTKVYEEIRREPLSEAIAHFEKKQPKGEFVLLFSLKD